MPTLGDLLGVGPTMPGYGGGRFDLQGRRLLEPDDPILNVPQPGYGEFTPNVPALKQGGGPNLRSILGVLGDALSVGSGGQPYSMIRHNNEKYGQGLSQALGGDFENGLNTMAQAGGPDAVNDFVKNYAANSAHKASNELLAQKQKEATDSTTEARLAGLLATADEKSWPEVVSRAKQYARVRNYDISSLNIPETFQKGWAQTFQRSLLTPKESISADETARYHDILNSNADSTRLVNAKLGQARVLQGISAQENANHRADVTATTRARAEEGRNRRAAAVEAGKRDRSVAATIARVVKDNPGAIVERSNQGRVRYSTDGGKSWNMAN